LVKDKGPQFEVSGKWIIDTLKDPVSPKLNKTVLIMWAPLDTFANKSNCNDLDTTRGQSDRKYSEASSEDVLAANSL
jgi:hypothetical protein